MIRVGAGTQHKKEKKQPKIPLECFILRPKFLECICLEKTPTSFPLDTHTSKKTKEMVKITKSTRSLFLSTPRRALFLSLFLSFVLCFLCVRYILSLSPFVLRVCLRLCACGCLERPDLRLGVSFPFQPQDVFFSRTHVLTFPLFIIF